MSLTTFDLFFKLFRYLSLTMSSVVQGAQIEWGGVIAPGRGGLLCSQFALHPQRAGHLLHSLTQNPPALLSFKEFDPKKNSRSSKSTPWLPSSLLFPCFEDADSWRRYGTKVTRATGRKVSLFNVELLWGVEREGFRAK